MGKKWIKKTHNEFINEMFVVNPNIIIIGEYVDAKTKIKCQCNIDNHEWESTPNNLLRGNGCPKCNNVNTSQRCKKDESVFINQMLLINNNIEFISNYIKSNVDIKCRCKLDGCEWDMKPSNLLIGHGCPICSKKKRFDKSILPNSEFVNRLKQINHNIEPLEEYKGTNVKIKCKCIIDNFEWYPVPTNLYKGEGCPKCKCINLSNENSSSWKGGISSLSDYIRNHIRQWKYDSIKSSNYKCIITGNRFDVIHHLYSFNLIVKETLSILHYDILKEIHNYSDEQINNIINVCVELHYKYGLGVCLCNEEHELFHSIYGRGDNTPEQFEEFIKLRQKQLIA